MFSGHGVRGSSRIHDHRGCHAQEMSHVRSCFVLERWQLDIRSDLLVPPGCPERFQREFGALPGFLMSFLLIYIRKRSCCLEWRSGCGLKLDCTSAAFHKHPGRPLSLQDLQKMKQQKKLLKHLWKICLDIDRNKFLEQSKLKRKYVLSKSWVQDRNKKHLSLIEFCLHGSHAHNLLVTFQIEKYGSMKAKHVLFCAYL